MRISPFFLTASLLLTTPLLHAQMSTQDLLAYYPFSGNTLDASGNGHHIVNSGAVPAASQTGYSNAAYAFNGTSAYMRIPASAALVLNGDYSVCLKVKPTGYYQGTCHGNSLFSTGNDGTYGAVNIRFDDQFYTYGQNCSNPVVDTLHQTFYGFKASGATVPNVAYPLYATRDTWRSLVFSQVGDSLIMYVNATKIQAAYNPASGSLPATDIFLGKLNSLNYPYFFNGVLDEVMIYGRGLSQEEINYYHNYDPSPVPTAVSETAAASGIRFSPNPATDRLLIENPSGESLSYRITAVNGSLLATGTLEKGQGVVPVQNLSAGLYFLHMQSGQAMQTVRFVKE